MLPSPSLIHQTCNELTFLRFSKCRIAHCTGSHFVWLDAETPGIFTAENSVQLWFPGQPTSIVGCLMVGKLGDLHWNLPDFSAKAPLLFHWLQDKFHHCGHLSSLRHQVIRQAPHLFALFHQKWVHSHIDRTRCCDKMGFQVHNENSNGLYIFSCKNSIGMFKQ